MTVKKTGNVAIFLQKAWSQAALDENLQLQLCIHHRGLLIANGRGTLNFDGRAKAIIKRFAFCDR